VFNFFLNNPISVACNLETTSFSLIRSFNDLIRENLIREKDVVSKLQATEIGLLRKKLNTPQIGPVQMLAVQPVLNALSSIGIDCFLIFRNY
jgi:hypothetical protein